MMRSCSCRSCVAWVMPMPGSDVGMYSAEPSYSGGMNWLPRRKASGIVAARKIRLRAIVNHGHVGEPRTGR